MAIQRDRGFRRSSADRDTQRRVSRTTKTSSHRDGTLRHRMTLVELHELDAELDAQIAAIIAGNNSESEPV